MKLWKWACEIRYRDCVVSAPKNSVGSVVYMEAGITVGIATGLRSGWPGFLIWAEARDFYLIQNCHTSPSSYAVGTGILSVGQSGRDLELTTHVHLVSRFRISGAILEQFYLRCCMCKGWRHRTVWPSGHAVSSSCIELPPAVCPSWSFVVFFSFLREKFRCTVSLWLLILFS